MTFLDQATPTVLLVSLAAGTAVIAYAAYKMFPKKKEYRRVGKVAELWVYPVKSCKGIKVDQAECTRLGIKRKGFADRHWAISTSAGTFISQRQEPSMTLVQPSLEGTRLTLEAPGMKPISFEAFPEPKENNLSTITVWGTVLPSVGLGEEVNKWWSTYLKREGVLMHFSAPSLGKKDITKVDLKLKYPAKPGDLCAYPDGAAYMILSNQSIDYINSKLENSVTVMNFRPNILIDVSEAFAEDAWSMVRIGETVFRTLDHCTRCILTTVDPETGKKDAKGEPLAALKKHRTKKGYGKDPCFGMYHAMDQPGTIKVGDEIYAIDG